MRIGVLVPAAVLIGVVTGVAVAYWEYRGPLQSAAPAASKSATDGPQPKAVAAEVTHNFGSMGLGEKKHYNFTVENKGEGVLKLTKGESTCKCTQFDMDSPEVSPANTGTVGLEWKGEGEIGPFRQTATILTNDPQNPKITFTIQGELTEAIAIEPTELVLNSLSSREPGSGKVRVFAIQSDSLEITGHHFEKEDGGQQFEVSFEPLPADELTARKAKSGMLATVTSKPPLPLGPVRHKITLDTNLAGNPRAEISLNATVVSDVSIIGPDFNSEAAAIKMGLVKSREGAKRTLRLVTRGAFRKEIKFSVASKTPEFLEVKFGDMIEVNQGLVTQVPITVEIPKGAPQCNHLGSALGKMGEVMLETNHPDAKQVRLRVQFAVEE